MINNAIFLSRANYDSTWIRFTPYFSAGSRERNSPPLDGMISKNASPIMKPSERKLSFLRLSAFS